MPPGTDSPDPPVGCGDVLAVAARAKGLVAAVVAERPIAAPPAVDVVSADGEAFDTLRAKGLVDFCCPGIDGGGELPKFCGPPPVLVAIMDCRNGLVVWPVSDGTCRPAGGGDWNGCGCCWTMGAGTSDAMGF